MDYKVQITQGGIIAQVVGLKSAVQLAKQESMDRAGVSISVYRQDGIEDELLMMYQNGSAGLDINHYDEFTKENEPISKFKYLIYDVDNNVICGCNCCTGAIKIARRISFENSWELYVYNEVEKFVVVRFDSGNLLYANTMEDRTHADAPFKEQRFIACVVYKVGIDIRPRARLSKKAYKNTEDFVAVCADLSCKIKEEFTNVDIISQYGIQVEFEYI